MVRWEELYNLIIPKSVSMRRQKLDLEWVVNMNKADVIAYFDGCAPTWDQELLKNDEVIAEILDHAGISENMDVLDIACGTGVLFPYYTKRGVTSVTGVDISPEMVKIARGKYADSPQITVICGDIEEIDLKRRFDAVVVYNAFPHFCDAERLIKRLAALTKPGGRLTIAHGMSRDKINAHHQGSVRAVSNGLMPADQLAGLFSSYFDVDVVISNDSMYQVSGNRNQIGSPYELIGRE